MIFVGLIWTSKSFALPQILSKYFLEDKSRSLSIDEISVPGRTTWTRLEEDNIGPRSGKIWIHLQVADFTDASTNTQLFLNLGFHYFNEVDFYYRKCGTGRFLHKSSGKSKPFGDRDIEIPNIGFVFDSCGKEASDIFLAISSSAIIKIPMSLRSVTEEIAINRTEFIWIIFFFGASLSIIFYLLLTSAIAKSLSVFMLFLYLLLTLLYAADIRGIAYQYIWPNWPKWGLCSSSFLASGALSSFSYFLIRYFKIQNGWQFKAIFMSIFVQLFALILNVIFLNNTSIIYHHLAGAFSVIIAIIVSIDILRNEKYACIFLSSYLSVLIGVLIFLLKNSGVIPINFLSENVIPLSILAQVILITIGFSWKQRDTYISNSRLESMVKASSHFAHETRRPVENLSRFLKNILTQDDVKAYVTSYHHLVDKDFNSARMMIRQLMELGKPRQLEKTYFNIRECLEDASSSFSRSILLETFDAKVSGNRENIKHVFENIIENAIHATEKVESTIWVKSVNMKQKILIEIGNTHSFIHRSNLCRLFDMYFTQGKGDGLGLGLSFAKKVVEDSGGRIWCESNGFSSENKKVPFRLVSNYVIFFLEFISEG